MNVLITFDEIFLKGKNQPVFLRKLKDNLIALFSGISVSRVQGGFILKNFMETELARLAKIPGIAKFSEVVRCPNDFESITKTISIMNFDSNIEKFRISANRLDKKHPSSSRDLNISIGDWVRNHFGWTVDLEKFDLDLHVDVVKDDARIYKRMADGAGGLPTGSLGKVLCLISGGIDSSVAAYQMMKRGAEVSLIHFQNQTSVADEVSRKILDLGNVLASYQPKVELIIYPFAEIQKQIIMKIKSDHRMIVSRRLMFKIAETIALNKKCGALATGDSLGQVASQTIENLSCIYDAVKILKLAPLISFNKVDIMHLARKIGTLDISNRPYEDCCSLFVAKHPETKAKLHNIEMMEKGLELDALDKIKPISYYLGKN